MDPLLRLLKVNRNSDGSVEVEVEVEADRNYSAGGVAETVAYMAAAPVERRASFTGSGLPYPNRDAAFSGPRAILNRGVASVDRRSRRFTARLRAGFPGAFYDVGRYVPPALFVRMRQSPGGKSALVQLCLPLAAGQDLPHRFLAPIESRRSEGAGFYDAPLLPDARSQADILRAGRWGVGQDPPGGDEQSPDKFWATRPRV